MNLEELINTLQQELDYTLEKLEQVEYQNQVLTLQNQDLNQTIERLKECQMN